MKSLGKFPDTFLAEIAGQPGAVRRAGIRFGEHAPDLEGLSEAGAHARTIVFTGMGSSYHACYAPVTMLAQAGIAALMVDTAELVNFRLPILNGETLLVVVSQSGESAEVVRLVHDSIWPAGRPVVVSVTNGLDNSLARGADMAFDTMAGAERGPSTMTFAAALLVLDGVSRVLGGESPREAAAGVQAEAERTARSMERILEDAESLAGRLVRWLSDRTVLALLGRGAARPASEMGALLLKEAARFPAESLEAAQFRHGPLELAGPELAVAIVSTEADTRPLDLRLATDLLDTGSAVLVVGPSADTDAPAGAEAVAIDELRRSLAPALAVLPLQLLAWRLAVERGLDPAALTIASKVTTSE